MSLADFLSFILYTISFAALGYICGRKTVAYEAESGWYPTGFRFIGQNSLWGTVMTHVIHKSVIGGGLIGPGIFVKNLDLDISIWESVVLYLLVLAGGFFSSNLLSRLILLAVKMSLRFMRDMKWLIQLRRFRKQQAAR